VRLLELKSDGSSGEIVVADHNGVYVIKMSGDVRLTLCIPFDNCIENLIERENFDTILFDLNDASGLDSTTLGLIVKLAVKSKSKCQKSPLLLCKEPAIKRLIMTMGLDDVCELINDVPHSCCALYVEGNGFTALEPSRKADESLLKSKILESHYALMELNKTNEETFKDLVQTLKDC
jgi:anti-anti-sigma factor